MAKTIDYKAYYEKQMNYRKAYQQRRRALTNLAKTKVTQAEIDAEVARLKAKKA